MPRAGPSTARWPCPGSKSIANRALVDRRPRRRREHADQRARRRRHDGDAALPRRPRESTSNATTARRPSSASRAAGCGRCTGSSRRRARRHDVPVRHGARRPRRRSRSRSTATAPLRRAADGASCTTRSSSLGAGIDYGGDTGRLPVTVTGPIRAWRHGAPPRRRVQPVRHGADADRPAPRRRHAHRADVAAGVAALRAPHRHGDGGVRRRRVEIAERSTSSSRPAATAARRFRRRAGRLLGELPVRRSPRSCGGDGHRARSRRDVAAGRHRHPRPAGGDGLRRRHRRRCGSRCGVRPTGLSSASTSTWRRPRTSFRRSPPSP